MKHIEYYIKESWNKIPEEFKKKTSYNLMSGVDRNKLPYGIWLDEEKIEKILQKQVDKIMVGALSKFYGFDEEQAHKLLEEMSK